MTPTPLTVSVRDAALATSLSEYEIRELVNKGVLQARRSGRRVLVEWAALESHIRSLPPVVEPESA
jgi:hypothetical protein